MQSVIELPSYLRAAASILTEKEREDIVTLVSFNPTCGDLIPGSGGFRKVRIGRAGMGKRGGSRVVYVVRNEDFPIFLAMVYAKNDKANLSRKDCNELSKLAQRIFDTYGRK